MAYKSGVKFAVDRAFSEIIGDTTKKALILSRLGAAASTGGTFTTTTQVSPAITGTAGTGFVIAKRASFVEDATSLTHTATFTLPAGSVLIDIIINAGVLWGGGTATMKVGDTADDDGYFIGVNLKATDLLVGEQLRISSSTLWGGKEGAYLVAATGQRGPTTSNFGGAYVAGSNITGIITVGTPAVTTGRTYMTVLYSTGQAVTPVLA